MQTLTLRRLAFSYGTNQILQDINCAFRPGEVCAILGPNGSGKTTLLDLISGFLKPLSGQVLINDNPIKNMSKKKLAQTIALVSQDYAINFPFLVKDVVMMGRHPYIPRFSQPANEDFERVDLIMELCGIYPFKEKKITELSGGEKQRCVFARALCQDTPILLLDEAFSSMDIHHTLQLLRIVKDLVDRKNRTALCVFHDLNIAAAWSDRILMLKNGEIKGFGSTQSIFTREMIQDVFNVKGFIEYNDHVKSNQIFYPIN